MHLPNDRRNVLRPAVGLLVAVGLLLSMGCGGNQDDSGADADPGPEGVAVACMAPPDTLVTGSAAGGLRIGHPAERVHRECNVVADTTLLLEGMSQPALLVDLAGDTIVAEIVDGSVWRIVVRSPGLATADSIRVGTPARRVAELDGAAVHAGEGRDYVITPTHCGLSFEVAARGPGGAPWTVEALRAARDDVGISRILVVGGCDSPVDPA